MHGTAANSSQFPITKQDYQSASGMTLNATTQTLDCISFSKITCTPPPSQSYFIVIPGAGQHLMTNSSPAGFRMRKSRASTLVMFASHVLPTRFSIGLHEPCVPGLSSGYTSSCAFRLGKMFVTTQTPFSVRGRKLAVTVPHDSTDVNSLVMAQALNTPLNEELQT
jgi:hypothetical protein